MWAVEMQALWTDIDDHYDLNLIWQRDMQRDKSLSTADYFNLCAIASNLSVTYHAAGTCTAAPFSIVTRQRKMADHDRYLKRAIWLAAQNVEQGGRPFGAVVVRNDAIVAEAVNTLHTDGDPTAHAELNAIRDIAKRLGNAALRECVMYASGQPCPMCLSAMYLTGVREVYFANSNRDGESFGLSTAEIYQQLQKPLHQQSLAVSHRPQPEGIQLYMQWSQRP